MNVGVLWMTAFNLLCYGGRKLFYGLTEQRRICALLVKEKGHIYLNRSEYLRNMTVRVVKGLV